MFADFKRWTSHPQSSNQNKIQTYKVQWFKNLRIHQGIQGESKTPTNKQPTLKSSLCGVQHLRHSCGPTGLCKDITINLVPISNEMIKDDKCCTCNTTIVNISQQLNNFDSCLPCVFILGIFDNSKHTQVASIRYMSFPTLSHHHSTFQEYVSSCVLIHVVWCLSSH